jgi:methionyl aminopeptidase
MFIITTAEELAGMQTAGMVARQVLEAMKCQVRPGVTTAELDAIGTKVMQEHGAQSAPAMVYRFPGGSCISVNDEVVHGIPGDVHSKRET